MPSAKAVVGLIFTGLAFNAPVFAQRGSNVAPATMPNAMSATMAPASAPSLLSAATSQPGPTSAPVKKLLVVPPGFKVLSENDRNAVIEPADEEWARKTLIALRPATMPTTMPTELLAQIHVKRAELVQHVVADLALPDKTETEKFFAETLEPTINRLEKIQPNLFYMATTQKRLAELMRSGWSNERFYYNRSADAVELHTNLDISTGDDLLLPAIFNDDDTPENKSKALDTSISTSESRILQEIANRGMIEMHRNLRAYLIVHVLPPSAIKDDQAWFVVGVGDVLAARYFPRITGAAPEPIMALGTSDNPTSPIRSATIDLLHPAADTDLRPQSVPIYRDAYTRKAMRVVYHWLTRAGDAALPKVLTELRKNPPANGEALLKQIQQISGIDLTSEVLPAP